uniref:Trafficking protein particle complex subunit n=1 Tax=Palpitomonas bilix TaxID=652834 RepID=A0A7S3G9P7_9EUKA|mmetsp:Transcript_38728/g.99434  ORF Transcript_38728/g.99434 Transcript_38728/m.99434 type:complete len:136 (+) Transcript_38728:206-613(+)|eukprot:CAMPEP_0113868918 /NCGR_PEP_ID=MMETSP0780_2-20120614/1254_1 /TAXON_ID=652834 /ORGANISM="Palpitomonas bilix" /LENGTH=135 /DNA_ID=CAMNT_0000854051 /DNA_START=206 /DNA_END=613 /DNA_ORIENTATION=- /assembly_acc=CAM_ASM_000599
MPRILALFIINKAGGLIFQRLFGAMPQTTRGNDYLRLLSTFHSLHTIASRVSPVPSGGIEVLEADSFKIQCFQTPTGIKFVLFAETGMGQMDGLLRQIYEFYADFVLKNPFYEMDQVIKSEYFDAKLAEVIPTSA